MQKVAFLIFDGVNALDVAGPMEAFATVEHEGGARAYDPYTLSLDGQTVRSESGLRLVADALVTDGEKADLLIVAGGAGLREPARLQRAAAWLRNNHQNHKRVIAVCTGAYALAESGLWDGRTVTTHWRFARDLARRYPELRVEADTLFIKDDRFYSCGGIMAGVDLALALIEEDHGSKVATAVARNLVVFLRRSGGQAQYSEPLKLQVAASHRLSDACIWASNNLALDLSVDLLAKRSGLSTRQFSRRFGAELGTSPAQYIQRLRLDAARVALAEGKATIEQVARTIGFQSPDGFRRAFERRFRVSPSDYRQRFSTRGPHDTKG